MSKGSDGRVGNGRDGERTGRNGERQGRDSRTSRSSVQMTAERARAIQAHADRNSHNQAFKSSAMSATAHDEPHELPRDRDEE